MVIGLNGLSIPKSGVDFFLIDRTVADMVIPRVHSSAPSFLLVGQTGVSATVVHYTKGERVAGKSGWTLRKKLGLFVGTALCSRVPAKILGALGLADRGPRFVIAEQINFDQVLSGACPTTPTLAAVNR